MDGWMDGWMDDDDDDDDDDDNDDDHITILRDQYFTPKFMQTYQTYLSF